MLFTWKFALLLTILLLSAKIPRVFCRYLCPLGAFYGLFHRFSFLRLKCDESACVHCGKCARGCKMQVDPSRHPDSAECIRCGECVQVCPTHALSMNFKAKKTNITKQKQEGEAK